MDFKVDEDLPLEAADLLRNAGHVAETIHGQQMVGQPDTDLAGVCRRERGAPVTLDLYFAPIRAYPPDHSNCKWADRKNHEMREISEKVRRSQPLLASATAAHLFALFFGSFVPFVVLPFTL